MGEKYHIQFSTALRVESCHIDLKAWPEAAIDIKQLKTPKHCKGYTHLLHTYTIPVKVKSCMYIIPIHYTCSTYTNYMLYTIDSYHFTSSIVLYTLSHGISESIWVLSIYCLTRAKNHLTGRHFVMCIRNSSTGENVELRLFKRTRSHGTNM